MTVKLISGSGQSLIFSCLRFPTCASYQVSMSVINVEEWEVDQVVDWIQGLDASLARYGQNFASKQIDGKRLLNFMAGDLVALGVEKVGDQVLLGDAIQSLRNELESDRITLQTLASNVAVRSKTYRSQLTSSRAKTNFISNESLASASYLLDAGKTLLRWLTRFPFLGVPDYDEITKQMTKHLFELAMLSQRDSFADNAIEEVQYLCTKIIEICDLIIDAKDSLTIQPAAVDVITIRKRHEQELGLQFESSYFGIHMVSGVNLASPAQQSGHLERGDEILQVNYQTVVGWTQQSLVSLLYENPCEIILTIKRRPRHASNSLGHMYLRPSKLPGRNSRSKAIAASLAILEVEDDEKEDMEATQKSPPSKSPTKETDSTATNSAAETRFWKLYPKPRNLLRRRATVTGASPTSTRPPVTFTDDDTIPSQSKPCSTSRHKLDKCVSAPERNKLEKQDPIDETLRLFVGDLNVRGSRITLPFVGPTNTIQSDFDKASPSNAQPDKSSTRPVRSKIGESGKDDSLDDVFEESIDSSESTSPKTETRNTKENIAASPTDVYSAATGEVTDSEPEPKPREPAKSPTKPDPIPKSRRGSLSVKPQSLTNLSSISDYPKPDTVYTGFLHQRQPHWKFGGPRWSRCRATVNSQMFRLLKPELEISISSSYVTLASEVHSRPFAFKLEDKKDKSSVHYFAAESQAELNIWLTYLGFGDDLPRGRTSGILNRSMSVQPDVTRNLSSPLSDKQRRLSLPQSHLQNQFRKKFNRLQNSNSASSSTNSIHMEDKLRFWNSSPSPTHKSNISSITITSCKRNQQQQELLKKKTSVDGPPVPAVRTKLTESVVNNDQVEPRTPPPLVKRSSLDSPTKKCRMGVTMLLRRKASDSVNNNDVCCTCGRGYSSTDKSTQTEELVLIFSGGGVDGESRI